ncbi:MAG: hypothetical protein GX326_04795 [Clostridiaceae bacterium]|nr:hypothetical protein [Clostridiaceae bacterium]
MDFFLNDAIRKATSTPISFSNGWRWGGAIPKGKLTLRDLYTIVPMDPVIMTAKLTGKEIIELLEENIENTFACDAFNQKGGYLKRNSGLKIYFKIENPYGQRIQKIFVGNDLLDSDKIYEVAYITVQAVPKNVGSDHKSTDIKSIEAMIQLLREGPYTRQDMESYIAI